MRKVFLLLACAALFASLSACHAGPSSTEVNGNFEIGGITGWTDDVPPYGK